MAPGCTVLHIPASTHPACQTSYPATITAWGRLSCGEMLGDHRVISLSLMFHARSFAWTEHSDLFTAAVWHLLLACLMDSTRFISHDWWALFWKPWCLWYNLIFVLKIQFSLATSVIHLLHIDWGFSTLIYLHLHLFPPSLNNHTNTEWLLPQVIL